jgi:hypothetical protein
MRDAGVPAPVRPQTRYSADGFWWWDGAEWRAALSQDRLWRWNGNAWEPARPERSVGSQIRGGGVIAIGIAVLVAVVAVATAVVLVVIMPNAAALLKEWGIGP